MLKNLVNSSHHTVTEYDLCFDDGHNNGFTFPCDENGKVSDKMSDAAKENYTWCMERPDRFVRFNKVVKQVYRVKDNAHGLCDCGSEVELYNEHMGACECPKCGKWYNLFGQELMPPEQWERDDEE